jgi:hypothetical protein
MLQDVKRKIADIRRRQRMALTTNIAGFVIIFLGFMLGILFASPTILMFAYVGLFIFFLSGCVWIYLSDRKNNTIKEFKTYLAMKELKTRSGDQEDWEFIQELLSSS